LGDFNVYVGKDADVQEGVIGPNGDANLNDKEGPCCNNTLPIMNTFPNERFSKIHLVQRFVGSAA